MKYVVSVIVGLAALVGTEIQAQAADTFTYAGFVTARVVDSQGRIIMKKIEAEGEEYDKILGGVGEFGEPSLLSKEVRIALPEGMTITHIEILNAEPETLSGNFYIFPAQPPVRGIIPSDPPPKFVEPDSQIYNSSEPYPGKFVQLSHEAYHDCGQRIAFLWIYSLQYIPKDKMLIFYPFIEFKAYYSLGGESRNPAALPATERERRECEETLKQWIINPQDVNIPLRPQLEGSKSLPPDTNEYVIITSSGLATSF